MKFDDASFVEFEAVNQRDVERMIAEVVLQARLARSNPLTDPFWQKRRDDYAFLWNEKPASTNVLTWLKWMGYGARTTRMRIARRSYRVLVVRRFRELFRLEAEIFFWRIFAPSRFLEVDVAKHPFVLTYPWETLDCGELRFRSNALRHIEERKKMTLHNVRRCKLLLTPGREAFLTVLAKFT